MGICSQSRNELDLSSAVPSYYIPRVSSWNEMTFRDVFWNFHDDQLNYWKLEMGEIR